MTLDDQLAALAPLGPKAVMLLAGYKPNGNPATSLRQRQARIPDLRLREVARRLRAIADEVERLIPTPTRSDA
jgi:hypothetical protein